MSTGQIFRAAAMRVGGWASSIAFVGGFVADVLNPLAPFAFYFFAGAAVISVVALIGFITRLIPPQLGASALIFTIAITAVSGMLYLVQRQNEAHNGIIADLVPGVEGIQAALGIVAQDVAAIKEGVGRIEEAAARIEAQTTATSEQLSSIAESLSALTRTGGIIAEPQTAAEFYHNARTFEAQGDALAARRAYLELARFDLDAIDPWLRLATVVRVQDGRPGAREVFASLAPRAKSTAFKLAEATLYDAPASRDKLESVLQGAPNYGPAFYLLAQEYSEAKLGFQSLAERTREHELLGKFLDADAAGTLTQHVLDPSFLGTWLDDARRRKGVLDGAAGTAMTKPAIQMSHTGKGWMGSVQFPEAALSFSYSLEEGGPWKDSSPTQSIDPRTGKPFPNPVITFPAGAEPGTVYLKYIDMRGQEVGPFAVPFDGDNALQLQLRQMLDMTQSNWVLVQSAGGVTRIFFTQLVTARCAIKEVRYGINDAPLTTPFALPPCDKSAPYEVPAGAKIWVEAPADTQSVSIQVTYANGEQSDVLRFKP